MTIQEMREKMKALAEKARKLHDDNPDEKWTEEIDNQFNAIMDDIKIMNAAIDRKIALDEIEDVTVEAGVVTVPALATEVEHKPVYDNIGKQLIDVMDMTIDSNKAPAARERFQKTINAVNAKKDAKNLTTGTDSEGGYLVETDKSKKIIETEVATGVLVSRCASQPIGPESDSFEYFRADDRDRSAGTFLGGVQAFRKAETETMSNYITAGIEPAEIKLADMYCLLKVSNRMIRDHVALTGMVKNSVPKAFAFKSDSEIFEGNGAGQHLGIMKSDVLITVAKESSQTAATIDKENLLKMLIRFYGDLTKAAWFVNQDTLAQFPIMTVGDQPVFIPGGSFTNAPYGILFGIPIVPIEHCETLGTVGDIVLGDFSQYLRISKGETEEAESIHVKFLTDEKVFRWIKRNNGQPIHDAAITPLKGSNTLSPFVALATRA